MIPNKWKKHLILVQFGLKTENDLDNEIKRYVKRDILKLQEDLYTKMSNKLKPNAYIVSLVPISDYFKLPNYLIESEADIAEISQFAENYKNKFSEIWCCEKNRRKEIDNVVGRIALKTSHYTNEPEQMIEQVWSVNHRDIEKYSLHSNINYLRATREGWHRRYHLDCINVENSINQEIILNDFVNVVKNIEENREKIEEWLEYLKQIGIPEISLEYMLNGDKFKFIDWDTANDKKVIDSIFKEDFERN